MTKQMVSQMNNLSIDEESRRDLILDRVYSLLLSLADEDPDGRDGETAEVNTTPVQGGE
jgi:hypothetical protein